jgi:type III secretion protein D
MTAATIGRIEMPRGNAIAHRVLKLLSGRLSGKAYPLDGRDRVSIGHGLANDVVLRGAGTRDCAIELELNPDTARLRVLQGQIELLGRTLGAGEQAVLPAYLPFRLGEYLVAHGAPVSPRWEDATKIADTPCGVAVGPLQAPRLLDRLTDMARAQLGRIDRKVARLALGAGCAGLLCVAAAEPLGTIMRGRGGDVATLQRETRQAGFDGVTVGEAADGTLTVRGVVRDEPELARLRALALLHGDGVVVDAQTGPQLASAATDILQSKGVAARVSPAQPGALVVRAGYMPADRQAIVKADLQKDLPAVRQVGFRVDDSLDASPLQAFFTQSGAGLASIVADPAHIITADGSHWFPGATLPTGHHLVSVTPDAVTFEKDGRLERITP